MMMKVFRVIPDLDSYPSQVSPKQFLQYFRIVQRTLNFFNKEVLYEITSFSVFNLVFVLMLQCECGLRPSRRASSSDRAARCRRHILRVLQDHARVEICNFPFILFNSYYPRAVLVYVSNRGIMQLKSCLKNPSTFIPKFC